jgi:hypothetical protein
MSDDQSKVDRAAIAVVLKTAPCRCALTRWASSSCADGRRRLSWPSCHACRAIVCRLLRTYSEGAYDRCICRESRAFQQSNNGCYGHARLTGRLEVITGAECDIGTARASPAAPQSSEGFQTRPKHAPK